MTVQYLRALHSADFPRGREKGGCSRSCGTTGGTNWSWAQRVSLSIGTLLAH